MTAVLSRNLASRTFGIEALRLSRLFPAPREAVYRAFTDAARLREWWGPRGFRLVSADFRPEPGRSYRVELVSPEGISYIHAGVFEVVRPPSRLVYTWRWEAGPLDRGETRVDLSFRRARDLTLVLLVHEGFQSATARDRHTGWTEGFDRLSELLQREAPDPY